MTLNIGIDIEKISRFEAGSKPLLEKIFTKRELRNIKMKDFKHIAGIYCAKEAIIKACSPVVRLSFIDIEIMQNKDGPPYPIIKKSKKAKIKELNVSISHTDEYAAAAAILLTR